MEAIQNTLSAVIGIVLGQVAFAERALIDHLIAGRGHRDHAGNLLGVAFLTQNLIDLGFALHGSPPVLIFMEWRDLPPGRRDPASARDAALATSRSRDGQGSEQVARAGATPNCNTSPQSAVDGLHIAVTAWTSTIS